MSDLLAPILYVMQNEVDAFWCFVGFMKRVSANFDFDQGGMKKQLGQLTELLKTYDPEFYSYLDAKDSGNLFFVFRWLLIWFKREFPFTDIMHMWEVLWTDKPCPKFHLLGKWLSFSPASWLGFQFHRCYLYIKVVKVELFAQNFKFF